MTSELNLKGIAALVDSRPDLSGDDLARLAKAVARRRDAWDGAVAAPEPKARSYTRLYCDGIVEVWILGWCSGHETGLHDHDGSAGAVHVIEGELVEDLLVRISADEGLVTAPRRRRAGETFSFDGCRIHNVRHSGAVPALSVHVYSPPITRMGHYEQDDDGVFTRLVVDHAADE